MLTLMYMELAEVLVTVAQMELLYSWRQRTEGDITSTSRDRFFHLLHYHIHTVLYLHDMKQDWFLTMKGSMYITYCMVADMLQSTPEFLPLSLP